MIRLIPQAKRFYRMFSMQALAVLLLAQTVLATMDEGQKQNVLPFFESFTWGALGTLVTFVAGMLVGIGRLIDQHKTLNPPAAAPPIERKEHG